MSDNPWNCNCGGLSGNAPPHMHRGPICRDRKVCKWCGAINDAKHAKGCPHVATAKARAGKANMATKKNQKHVIVATTGIDSHSDVIEWEDGKRRSRHLSDRDVVRGLLGRDPKPAKPPAPQRCADRAGGHGMQCTRDAGHVGLHHNGRATWKSKSTSAKPAAKLTDECGKCGRELGEHDGTKCPPPLCGAPSPDFGGRKCARDKGHDGDHGDDTRRWPRLTPSGAIELPGDATSKHTPLTLDDEPDDPEADQAALAAMDASAADDLEDIEPSPAATSSPVTYSTITCKGRKWPVHPAALIFPTPEAQYREIVESIRSQGQKHPIQLLGDPANGYPVIDGCSRLRACNELGIEPRTEVINVDNPIKHVIAVNLARRHMDESQRAMAANELATMEQGTNQHTRTGKFAGPQAPTQAEAAQMLHVSERLVRDAARVKREAVPEVAEAVREGKLKVSAAAELAKLGPGDQRRILDKVTKGKGEVKAGKVRALVKQEEKRAVVQKINKQQVHPMPLGPFRLILIDPPWPYDNSDQHEGSRGHIPYPPMPLEDICRLRTEIDRVAHQDCILGMWIPNAFIHVVGRVLEAWGFEHRTAITWTKDRVGLGTWARGMTEHLIIASRGSPVHTLNEITTHIPAPVREHSRKPDVFPELLAKHCPGPCLEMFAREEREGWRSWGAETDKFDAGAA